MDESRSGLSSCSPLPSRDSSFDALSSSATSVPIDSRRSIIREANVRSSLEEEVEDQSNHTKIQRQVFTRG